MNNKMFGIIVCILLMTGYITVAENIEKTSQISTSKKISNVSFEDDVPVWTVDNYWNFKIEDMTVDYEKEGQYINVKLKTNNLQLKVIDVKTDSYILDINAELTGSGYAYINLGDGPVNITINLKSTKLTGTIVFNKSDMGIKQLNPKLEGRIVVNVIEQPYTEFSIPAIPIRATIEIFTTLATPLTIIDFPLNVSNIWGVPSANISIEGTIKSPWLYLINFLNNIAIKHWNLTLRIAEKLEIDEETVRTITDMLSDILPIINISYVLTEYMQIGNVFETPEIPTIFICDDIEEITVQGNSYNAYNISVIGGIGNIYYAPDAGNIIKIYGHFKDILPFISDLNIELKETNYQP